MQLNVSATHQLQGNAGGKPVAFEETRNHSGIINPTLLVFHYTACDFDVARTTFLQATGNNRVSAHLLVDTDGSVLQFVPFNLRAWHAGESQWGALKDINTHSIGIEVVNYGYLLRSSTGEFRLGNGKPIPFAPSEVMEAKHKNPMMPWAYWQAYTPEQIETCKALAALLVSTYGLVDVVGHDDIAPTRKSDPGPAFPLLSVQAVALGRNSAEFTDEVRYVGVKRLNIRTGAGVEHALAGEPLVMHAKLVVRGRNASGTWLEVDVASDSGARHGWVLADYTQANSM